jgi:hypothetical protein
MDMKKLPKLMLHLKPLEILRKKTQKKVFNRNVKGMGVVLIVCKSFSTSNFLNVFVVSIKVLLFTSVLVWDTATVADKPLHCSTNGDCLVDLAFYLSMR